jgi:hypothetical protein
MSMIDAWKSHLSACAILDEAYLQICQIRTCRLLASHDQDGNYGLSHISRRVQTSIRLAELGKTVSGSDDVKLLHNSTDKSRKIRGAHS